MHILSMTRIVPDIDSVDIIAYANAGDRREFVLDYCRDRYQTTHNIVLARVMRAFREAMEPTVNYGGSGLRWNIGVEVVY